jgi:hydrogenase 3 maturation protease
MSELRDLVRGKIVVLGVGNTYKSDDGAGSLVAQALRKRFLEQAFDAEAAPENFVAPVRRAAPDTVIIVDAGDFEAQPGEIRVIPPEEIQGLMSGTHATPMSLFLTLISQETSAQAILVAVQAKSTEFGGPVSPEVAAAVDRLVDELADLMEPNDTERREKV